MTERRCRSNGCTRACAPGFTACPPCLERARGYSAKKAAARRPRCPSCGGPTRYGHCAAACPRRVPHPRDPGQLRTYRATYRATHRPVCADCGGPTHWGRCAVCRPVWASRWMPPVYVQDRRTGRDRYGGYSAALGWALVEHRWRHAPEGDLA